MSDTVITTEQPTAMSDVTIIPKAPPNCQIAAVGGDQGGNVSLGMSVSCQGVAGAVSPAEGSSLYGAFGVLGVAVAVAPPSTAFPAVNEAGAIYYQYTGIVELTNAQWQAVNDGGGVLSPGTTYYLSSTNPGNITSTKPVATGTYAVQVGIALSTNELQLIPGAPVGPHS